MHYKLSARPTHASYFIDHNVVAIGWQGLDFSQLSDAEIRNEITAQLPESTGSRIGQAVSQALRFQNMEAGAKVLVPVPYGVLLAEVNGETRTYEEGAAHLDIPNQRAVKFLLDSGTGKPLTIPRVELSEGLSRRIKVPGSYCQDLTEFSGEIEGLFTGETVASQDRAKEVEVSRAFADALLIRLRDGSSLLPTGGRGLEELVRDVFIADGYIAETLSKKIFSGIADADVRATKENILGSMLVYVQVKHHTGPSGNHGLNQLIELINSGQADDATHFVLLTTGELDEKLHEKAEKTDEKIILIDGPTFVERLISVLPQLDRAWWKVLRISEVPRLVG